MKNDLPELKSFLDNKVTQYNHPSFIKDDPISVPHLFTKIQDVEIAGFFAAIFAWGNRTTIINKSTELMLLMHNAPYDFCINHSDKDLKSLLHFKHRTFNATDLLYFISFFKMHYAIHAWNPPFKWMKPLWRNHHLHHYKNVELGFGVSSTLWDHVFGTMFDLKKEKEDKDKVRELMFESSTPKKQLQEQ